MEAIWSLFYGLNVFSPNLYLLTKKNFWGLSTKFRSIVGIKMIIMILMVSKNEYNRSG